MKKLLSICAGTALTFVLTTSAYAAGSSAIIQELGTVMEPNELSLTLVVKSFQFPGASLGPVTANGTVGGTTLTSIKAGLGNGFEARIGTLPGVSSLIYDTQGLTVKYSGLIPGVSVYGAYGSLSNTPLGAATATETSANRIGAAVTLPFQAVFVNLNAQGGSDNLANNTSRSVTDIGAGIFYPLNPNVVIALEYLNTNMVTGPTTVNLSGYGLGGKATMGNWTLGVILYANVTESVTGIPNNARTVPVGAPSAITLTYTF